MSRIGVVTDSVANPCVGLFVTHFTPVMGAHTGSGVVGMAF